ncbi:hypothetical protein G3576_26580 [Roseomonas stagni]|uniref:Uncharacterized protein n=1 Tax=Falsiroseomonas algicola TaxID=2716930 RepID=A0A6M1LSX3_9PROT|nr:hypothetical protein [Falsiroseomonas algicola]NGM23608.1 hypothetical protein [Falsiroseomonas algicola]
MPEASTFRDPVTAAPPVVALAGGVPQVTALVSPSAPPLAVVMRDALRAAAGRVVLRVRDLPAHRRRVARALLQEGALAAGGTVLDGPGDDLLLVGAEAARAERLRALLDRLLGAPATGIWSLERDAPALLDYAAGRDTLAEPIAAGAGPDLAGLDDWLPRVPLEGLVSRHLGYRLEPGGAKPAFLRLDVARDALARRMGVLGQDRDLVEYASRAIAGRLLRAVGDPAQRGTLIGDRLPGPLHLPVPPAALTGRDGGARGGSMLVAAVAAEEAADPRALAARREVLAGLGWSMELDGLTAEMLGLMAPDALPADWLRLQWSEAVLAPSCYAALRRVDPARLTLAGVRDADALAWARSLGVTRIEPTPALAAALRLPA